MRLERRAGRHGELLGGRGAERGGPTRPAAHGEAGSGGAGARQDEGGGLASAGACPKQRGGRFPGAARGRPPAPPAGTERRKTTNPQCFLQDNGSIHGLYLKSVWATSHGLRFVGFQRPVKRAEILFICAGGRRGSPRLSLSQREVSSAFVLGHGEWPEKGNLPRSWRHLSSVRVHSSSIPASQLGWHWLLLEFHHLFKQQEGPDPPAYKVKTIAEILKHTNLAENISKDLYIEVYPGTYSVTVGTSDLTRTQVVAVDSGQSVDLVFPI